MVTAMKNACSGWLVPEGLWAEHKTGVGLVATATPVKISLKPNVQLPYQPQYKTTPEAIEGIEPTIEGLKAAGVLIPTQSPCSTPILPIKKPHTLVHDLRAINNMILAQTPVVPDPHTLLSNIPPDTKYYTVYTFAQRFFSNPLHPQSQYLFAFTYKGQQLTYTRMPQGYCESPSAKIGFRPLNGFRHKSTLLQYMDYILLCSPTHEQC